MRTHTTKAALLTLALAVLFPAAAYAQCDPAEAEAALDINNVRARIFNDGALFWRGGRATYEVPRDEGNDAIFTANLWVGGFAGDVVVGGIGGAVLMIAVGIIRKLVGNQDSPRHR